jgi:hypothetical protein
MPDELKPEPRDDFAADFRDGEAMAQEWIEGRGDLPDLLHIVREMPRGVDLGGLEAGFLSTIDARARGAVRGDARAPDVAHAKSLLDATPPLPPVDIDAFRRRQREHELAARFERLAKANAEAFMVQQHAFSPSRDRPKGADWS